MKFTIWNYRNIPMNSPLSFDLKEGITFILGPNNCGKTNIIKFFYDFRDIVKAYPSEVLISGGYKAKLEDYFDNILHRLAPRDEIRILVENENNSIAEYLITPVTERQRHAYDVNVTLKVKIEDRHITDEIAALFLNSFFVGQTRTLSSKTFSKTLDLETGNVFVANFSKWADGEDILIRRQMAKLKEELRVLFGFQRFDIRLNDTKSNLLVSIDEEVFDLSELGTGIAEFITVLSNATMKAPSYIFVDEPETSLHPQMQEVFIRALAEKSKAGVFATSHSIGMARSSADYIYSLTKTNENIPIIRKFGEHYNPTIAQSAGEMSYSQYVEIGGINILLVEGRTDVKAFREILRKYDIEREFIILPFGGSQFMANDKSKIVEELAELKRFNAKSVNVIFDSEKSAKDDLLNPAFEVFAETCKDLGFNVFPTDYHSTENYITQSALDKVMGEGYQSLGPYEKFGRGSLKWPKEKNWLMFVEMDIMDFDGTELNHFIREKLMKL